MPGTGAPGETGEEAAGILVPMRCTEARERGHQIHAAVVRHAGGERLDLAAGLDDPEPVPQPLHRRAGDEDAAF